MNEQLEQIYKIYCEAKENSKTVDQNALGKIKKVIEKKQLSIPKTIKCVPSIHAGYIHPAHLMAFSPYGATVKRWASSRYDLTELYEQYNKIIEGKDTNTNAFLFSNTGYIKLQQLLSATDLAFPISFDAYTQRHIWLQLGSDSRQTDPQLTSIGSNQNNKGYSVPETKHLLLNNLTLKGIKAYLKNHQSWNLQDTKETIYDVLNLANSKVEYWYWANITQGSVAFGYTIDSAIKGETLVREKSNFSIGHKALVEVYNYIVNWTAFTKKNAQLFELTKNTQDKLKAEQLYKQNLIAKWHDYLKEEQIKYKSFNSFDSTIGHDLVTATHIIKQLQQVNLPTFYSPKEVQNEKNND